MVSGSDFYINPLTGNYGVEFVLKLAWYFMEKTKAMSCGKLYVKWALWLAFSQGGEVF